MQARSWSHAAASASAAPHVRSRFSLLASGGRLLPEIGSANATPIPLQSVNIPDVAGEKMMS